MWEGYEDEREYQLRLHQQNLHLQRMLISTMTTDNVKLEEIWPIPEIDKEIKKARAIEERKKEEHAQKVLELHQERARNLQNGR